MVAAVFFDEVSARDAIADLKLARFHAADIGVALSEEGKRAQSLGPDVKHGCVDLEGKHSILWKLRHSFEHDLHSHGPGLSSREDAAAANEEKPAYTEIDLADTLAGLGVAEDTKNLLNDRIGPDGLLILVDAGERVNEVESILVRNRGMLRSAMATQPSHAGS